MKHPKCEKWPYQKVLPEHVLVLIERYKGGESARKICLDMPFSEDMALKVLRDFDIPIKTRKDNRLSMGFTINESAFADVNEPGCAYFYGWILTDGNLRKGKYGHQVSISLKSDDKAVLESLRDYVNNGCSVKYRERLDKRTNKIYRTSSYSFSHHKLIDRLLRLGLEERKSTREFCPDAMLVNRDFWRGVLEGDGYLSKLSDNTRMQICGSEVLCNQWYTYCKGIVPDMHMTITRDSKNNGLFHTYSGRFTECKTVLDSLYLGVPENLRLERKYNLYVGRYYDGIDPNRTS